MTTSADTTPTPPQPAPLGKLHLARGFRYAGLHCGVKVSRPDLALIVSDRPAEAAAVVTPNRFRAACADRTARLTPAGGFRAVVVNSGNANCRAGAQEAANDERMAATIAEALDCAAGSVLTASTGSIGKPLPIDAITAATPRLIGELSDDPQAAAAAILTTDQVLKGSSRTLTVDGQTVNVTAIAKGSGMIHPGMATMLGFIQTDAACDGAELKAILRDAVDASFNQISVDRDMSTNDMVVLLANGAAGVTLDRGCEPFVTAIRDVCRDLARAIARDGEGATRLVSVEVSEAPDLATARTLARAVVESNLFKAALFGNTDGWGRALAALGARAAGLGLEIDPAQVGVRIGDSEVVRAGGPTGEKPDVNLPEVVYRIAIGLGDVSAWAWGCDLSYDYVSINAVTKTDGLDTHSPGLKRRLLVEALTYIRRFKKRLAVVKYGGAAMLRDDLKDAFAEDLVLLEAVGLLPVVVHGGGPEISRTLEQLGEGTRFVDGKRVTDEGSIKVVEMVLTGRVNTDVVTRVHKHGGRAVGLSGKDGSLLLARKLEPGGQDLGLVGEVTEVNTDVITMLLERDYIPIISPVGVDAQGTTYNINADTAAAKIAEALGAEKLIFLTDVPGILKGGEKVSQASVAEVRAMLRDGTVSGGMIPKTEALLSALEGGVRSAHIIDGRVPHNLLAELFTDHGVGTWIQNERPR